MPFRTLARTLPILFVLALPAPAAAATDERTDTQVFPAEWFAAASPVDAADMVERLPGFSIVEGDEDVRGYSAAQGNVLIDGVRPASKREDIGDLLDRIPAAAVERIELIRGGAGVDMAGHALLANVVRRADPAPELALEVGAALAGDGWSAPLAEVEYGWRRDGRVLDLALSRTAKPEEESGRGTIDVRTADGEAGTARTDDRGIATEQSGTLHWRQPLLGGQFDADAALREDDYEFQGRTEGGAPGIDDEQVREDEDQRETEFGLRWERQVGETRIALLASHLDGDLDVRETEAGEDGLERFDERTQTSESLASFVAGREFGEHLAMTAGLELANNQLDSRARLAENGEPVELPGSHASVDEDRGEAAFGLEWQAAERVELEAGLRIEHSRLTQGGDSPASRRFTYAKPRIGATWEPAAERKLRWSLAREVGQLDFGDFVASASLADDEVSAGNATLEPDKTWRSELAWEQSFGTDGSFVLAWIHDRIDDVVDRVPVTGADGEIFDAPGNIGDGTRDGLSLEVATSLHRFGMPSVRVAADVLWQRSRVDDPATGESRRISGDKPLEGSLSLEQVLAGGAATWGVELKLAEEDRDYRFDEVSTETEGGSWSLYGERAFGKGWRARAELSDADGQHIGRERLRYDGNRADGVLEEEEQRRHRTPGLLMLTLRREFGG